MNTSAVSSNTEFDTKNKILDIIEKNLENDGDISDEDFNNIIENITEPQEKSDLQDNRNLESIVNYFLTKYFCEICDNIECSDLKLGDKNIIVDKTYPGKYDFSLEDDAFFGYCHYFNNKCIMKVQSKKLVKDLLCRLDDSLYFNWILDIDYSFHSYENIKLCNDSAVCKMLLENGTLGEIYEDEYHSQLFFRYYFGEAEPYYITYKSFMNFFYMDRSNIYIYLQDEESEGNTKKVYGDEPHLGQGEGRTKNYIGKQTIYKVEPLFPSYDKIDMKRFEGIENREQALFFTRLMSIKRMFFDNKDIFRDKTPFLQEIINETSLDFETSLESYFKVERKFPETNVEMQESDKNACLSILYKMGMKASGTDSFLHIEAMNENAAGEKLTYNFTKMNQYHKFYETVKENELIRFYYGRNVGEEYYDFKTSNLPPTIPYRNQLIFSDAEDVYGDYFTISDKDGKNYVVNIESIFFDLKDENKSATWMYEITIVIDGGKKIVRKIVPEESEDKLHILGKEEQLTPSTNEKDFTLKMNLKGDVNDNFEHTNTSYILVKDPSNDPFPFLTNADTVFPVHHFLYVEREGERKEYEDSLT